MFPPAKSSSNPPAGRLTRKDQKVQFVKNGHSELQLVPIRSAGNFLLSMWGTSLFPSLLGNTLKLVGTAEEGASLPSSVSLFKA